VPMGLSEFVAFLDLELVVFTLAKVDIVKNCHLQLWVFLPLKIFIPTAMFTS